ncbi:odv-e56 [Clostera anastomosis granulovirus A]|uniref:Odv-e56 n=1 Tax=Clostera anastomosis granulovirus A TaxID=1986289 RepID=U5KBT6_9BBAC|nr:odv-e56 [Clostera anastomosis granulovirus Henan]AGQ20274.1 odv-e56 [Clostera anastomosis granulovirus Henan]
MSSFFTGLRRTNKVYPNTNSFVSDHARLIQGQTPAGFNLNGPTGMGLAGGDVIPGYNINGSFVSNATVNSILRNNDVTNMRILFPDATNNQMSGLRNMRRADNVPDATIHGLQTRKDNVRFSHPETAVRNRVGVENALAQNPRLGEYLRGLGYVTLVGVGVYLVVNVADLVGSIVEALNRTGGSWYSRGNNGADSFDRIESCVLRYRTCGVSLIDIQDSLCELDEFDATNVDPLMSLADATRLCDGYSLVNEHSVCRGSDTNADPTSPQYLDISELDPNQTIQCVEPYDLADLIADLKLDWLLGEEGLFRGSSNSLNSLLSNILNVLLVVGVVLLMCLVGYVVFKMVVGRATASTQA